MDLFVGSMSGARNSSVKSGLRACVRICVAENIKVDVLGQHLSGKAQTCYVDRWRLGGLKARDWCMLCKGGFRLSTSRSHLPRA